MGKKSKIRKALASGVAIEQVAALPFRIKHDEIEYLVITSRRRKRLIVPKGWPMPGKDNAVAAAIEADEEAGVRGRIASIPFGSFDYAKSFDDQIITVSASVYPLRVKKVKSSWKEQGERKRKWITAADAASMLDDEELRTLIVLHTNKLRLDVQA